MSTAADLASASASASAPVASSSSSSSSSGVAPAAPVGDKSSSGSHGEEKPFSDAYPAIVPGGYLCIAYVLKGKRVLIVGGGPVAAGRLVNVKDADAHVTVICPSSGLNGEMKYRLARGEIDEYHDRLFGGESELDLPEDEEDDRGKEKSDGSSFFPRRARYDLVLTATDDIALSRAICEMCRARRIPVNVADVPPECDFYFGSLIRRGALQVMVSTGGKGPKIANQVRTRLERALPPELAGAIANVGALRARLRSVAPAPAEGGRRMRWMIEVCERWTWRELARMEEGDMAVILENWTGAGKRRSIPSLAECRRTRLRRERGASAVGSAGSVVLGNAREEVGLAVRSAGAALANRCPISGSISPWLAGLLGLGAGAGVGMAVGMLVLRAKLAGR
ncbi:Bifunctional dehydrogenase and ferrochelatase [Tilletia horrida]|nr:Bifunctional dehydrogenase and ferrochelatase [Tilletia horrida]